MISYNFSHKEYNFWHLFVISVFLHVLIFFFLPSPKVENLKPEPIEVEFIETSKIPVSQTKKITPKKKFSVSQRKKTVPKAKSKVVPKKNVVKPILHLTPTQTTVLQDSQKIQLSSKKNNPDFQIPKNFLNEEAKQDLSKKIEWLGLSDDLLKPKDSLHSAIPQLILDKERPPEQSVNSLKSIPLKAQTNENFAKRKEFSGDLQSRKVIYRPSRPFLNIEDNTTIAFQVVVNPAGEVVDIFPLKKGNAELEKIGKAYLLKFRFEPFAGNRSHVGIIRLKVIRGVIR